MIVIEVPDVNDSMSELDIDGVVYGIRFTYNESFDFWSFGIYDEDEEPIVTGTRIVPNFSLLQQYVDNRLPDGEFYCYSIDDEITDESFSVGDAEFVYIPNIDDEDDDEDEGDDF